MTARQRIIPVRRQYNQWVADETLEDFALRFTAKSARRWTVARVANTALGAVSFLALEAIGGTVTLAYGFDNALAAILCVSALIFLTGLPISYYAARYGVDIDLLTRGAGFGYIGSTITSLIYASFTFIFFAIEAVIMALALEMCFGLPLPLGYFLSACAVIPIVMHGITLIGRFHLWTQPLWIVLQLVPFVFIAMADGGAIWEGWTRFPGMHGTAVPFDLLAFGAASSVLFALIAQIGEQVDILRFLPRATPATRLRWWASLLAAGPGWVVPGVVKMFAGGFLAYLALSHGVPASTASEPTQMYLVAFGYVFGSPQVALVVTGVFVIVSQLKINVTNSYAGSIAWSNFFSRLTHSHPGRVVWLVFNVAIALLLMEVGIYKTLEHTLGLYSVVAVAWVGSLVSDLVVNKPLGLSPRHIEFKRAHLYDINPVGVGSMLLATVLAGIAVGGGFGATAQALAPFIALGTAFVTAPAIAWATGGRYYLARKPRRNWHDTPAIQCCICERDFEPEDMAHCPIYAGPICSLCCSLDARCHDSCKTGARIQDQVRGVLAAILPRWATQMLYTRTGHYLGVLSLFAVTLGLVLSLIYMQAIYRSPESGVVVGTLWAVFIVLMIIAGIAAWLFVLAQESRKFAQDESRRQTSLLLQEIEAHKRTDAALQRAKEVAEAANLAKSRYVVGISHELRTPLNAVLGYAQLLDAEDAGSPNRRNGIRVIRRSAEHLAGLIDGLLDISKIEAGRLQLTRGEMRVQEFLAQLVDMFSLQTRAKGLEFRFSGAESLPESVYTDGKRLRQILINLLSNAVKFTDRGFVSLAISYRNQVAEFEVADSGIGIRSEDIGRIFEPFERGELTKAQTTPGTGLGLTITKLLVEIMGGEITVTSRLGRGTSFRVRLMLSAVPKAQQAARPTRRIVGYDGPRRMVLVADDDSVHLQLMREALEPLGLVIMTAPDGMACLTIADQCSPDLFLLDVSMPGMDGWELARRLREKGHVSPIVMMSANIGDGNAPRSPDDMHDEAIAKPFDLDRLLDRLKALLKLEWITSDEEPGAPAPPPAMLRPGERHVEDLKRLGEIGYIRGIEAKLAELEGEYGDSSPFVAALRARIREFDLRGYMAVLDDEPPHD